MVGQLGLEDVDLGLELGDHGDERGHDRSHRVGDDRRTFELLCAQSVLDLDGALGDPALPATASPDASLSKASSAAGWNSRSVERS